MIRLKNKKFKIESIIIGLIWFHFKMNRLPVRLRTKSIGLVWIFGFIRSIRSAYIPSFEFMIFQLDHSSTQFNHLINSYFYLFLIFQYFVLKFLIIELLFIFFVNIYLRNLFIYTIIKYSNFTFLTVRSGRI